MSTLVNFFLLKKAEIENSDGYRWRMVKSKSYPGRRTSLENINRSTLLYEKRFLTISELFCLAIRTFVVLRKKNVNDLTHVHRQKLLENGLSPLKEKDVESMVDRSTEFEIKLAMITIPNEQLQNPIELYQPMSVTELHQKYPAIDWIKFFCHLIPDDTSLPEKIIMTAPRFMERLNDWIANSPTSADAITTQSIREFFIVKFIMSHINAVDKKTRESYRTMYSKIASGTVAPPSRSRTCINSTSRAFGQLLGCYFVIKEFGGDPQRKQVSDFMNNIKQS
ncbi:peptidase family M13-domain-containing protein [Choanephora cucurbitarum]|nr:peptidase family M13-domain-containing protein [Choanephora cucurbitarum]